MYKFENIFMDLSLTYFYFLFSKYNKLSNWNISRFVLFLEIYKYSL
jgi:hypothetical protein